MGPSLVDFLFYMSSSNISDYRIIRLQMRWSTYPIHKCLDPATVKQVDTREHSIRKKEDDMWPEDKGCLTMWKEVLTVYNVFKKIMKYIFLFFTTTF
jgi:hypothetical protein